MTAENTPGALRLAPPDADNLEALLDVSVRPDQEYFVGSVAASLAEAYVHPDVAWPRAVVDGVRVVGFVMAFVDNEWDDADPSDVRSGLWRLNIEAGQQGRGYGRFAVEATCAHLRERGDEAAYVTYKEGAGSPAGFYAGLGFVPTGEVSEGEIVARLDLRAERGSR